MFFCFHRERVVQNTWKCANVKNGWSQLDFLAILLPLVRGDIGGQIFGPELISLKNLFFTVLVRLPKPGQNWFFILWIYHKTNLSPYLCVYTIWYTAFTYKYVSNYSFQGQMVRVYPSGMRIDSSNFNPVSVWSCGIQMVAMNYQTVTDTNLHLHNSLFNGTQGYILKVKVSLI